MSRQQIAIKNSMLGLVSQIVTLILQFWTRSIFVKYLGVEMLGISSTFSSVLNTLSLTELGFQSAVVYSLYKPLSERNNDKVNEIINVLKIIYRFIGCFFIVAGIICCPFLKYILSGVKVSITIYLIFLVQVSNSACSYFLAYKRTLLHADRKGYMTKGIDTAMSILFSLVKVIIVIRTSNYIYYAMLTTLQTIISNLFAHVVCQKNYLFLKKTKFNLAIFKDLWVIVKKLLIVQIAYYVYSSTDNLLISSIVGTVSVGYLMNYTTIISSIKTLANSILNPIIPVIGNMLVEESDTVKNEKVFREYTYIRYVIACISIIPVIVLIQSFISAWIGKEYLLSDTIVWLYCLDLYIHFVHSSLCDFINAGGLFREEGRVGIVGAILNLGISIALLYRLGIIGVLIGTVVSQSVLWICRSVVVYKNCFTNVKNGLKNYWLINVKYFGIFLLLSFMMSNVYQRISIGPFFVRFVIGGIVCEVIIFMIQILIFGRTEEYKQLKSMLGNMVKRLFNSFARMR